MARLDKLPKTAGQRSGRQAINDMKKIAANFAALEPSVTDNGNADYVPAITDQVITRSRATAQTLTIPTNATVPFPIGTKIDVVQTAAGALTIVPAGGVTLTKLAAKTLVLSGLGARVQLTKLAVNTWLVAGDLT